MSLSSYFGDEKARSDAAVVVFSCVCECFLYVSPILLSLVFGSRFFQLILGEVSQSCPLHSTFYRCSNK